MEVHKHCKHKFTWINSALNQDNTSIILLYNLI